MSQEKVLADFSGGINALVAVDKLAPNECLLAENVRLDESGNIASAGAYTHQNTSAYVSTASSSSAHSLFWNPSLGGIAGVGQDVFYGASLGQLANVLGAVNTNAQKMSFGSGLNRIYFDIGNTGYWVSPAQMTPLTVDWAPPAAAITGPNICGTGVNIATSGTWTNPNNVTSTSTASYATNTNSSNPQIYCTKFGFSLGTSAMQGVSFGFTATANFHQYVRFGVNVPVNVTVTASLLVNGVAVGNPRTYMTIFNGGTGTVTASVGGSQDLWNFALTPAQVNATNFGVGITVAITGALSLQLVGINGVTCTAYQANGLTAGTGAAGTLTGTYTWIATFVALTGEESDASAASQGVVLSTQQGSLTGLPLGDARTGSRNIYRTGGSLTTYYLVGSVPDNTTTTYSDNQSDAAALTAGIILTGQVPGDFPNTRLGNAQVRFPTYHYDRVFWINQAIPNQLIWSKPLNGFAYPSVNETTVGDSKPIIRTVSIFGELIIIKTDSIWVLTGTDESSFQLSQTPSEVGTDEPFTILKLPDKVIFANRYGIWYFNGYTSVPLTTKLDLWYRQQDRTNVSLFGANGFHPIEIVSGTTPQLFDSAGDTEKYYLAYAESGQSANNAILVFDLKHGNITKRSAAALALAPDPVNGYIYMSDSSGFVSLLDDWNGANSGGSATNFDFQDGYRNLAPGSNQAFWALEFYINTNGQSVTPHVYYDNGANSETLAAISTTSLQRVVRPLEASNSRKAQSISWRLNGSLNPVNSSGTPQVIVDRVKVLYDVRTGRARTGQ